MRRFLPILLTVVVAVTTLGWLAAPRLIDRFGPEWAVTATMPGDISDDEVRAVQDCVDVLASTRVVSDVQSGSVAADFHAFEWEVRRVTECLRELPGVEDVAAQER